MVGALLSLVLLLTDLLSLFLPYFESLTLQSGRRSTIAMESKQKALKDKSPQKKALKPKVLKEKVPRRSWRQDLVTIGLEAVTSFLKEEHLKVSKRSKPVSWSQGLETMIPAHANGYMPTSIEAFKMQQQHKFVPSRQDLVTIGLEDVKSFLKEEHLKVLKRTKRVSWNPNLVTIFHIPPRPGNPPHRVPGKRSKQALQECR